MGIECGDWKGLEESVWGGWRVWLSESVRLCMINTLHAGLLPSTHINVCVCPRVCVHACVRACVCACVLFVHTHLHYMQKFTHTQNAHAHINL
jgi:hypothetical protein